MSIHVLSLCEPMLSFLLGQYLGVDLQGHMVSLCLTLLETAVSFSEVPFDIIRGLLLF